MTAYPSHNILLESSVEEESGVIDDFAVTGTMHSRIVHSEGHYRFRLLHQLNVDEFNTLRALYNAGKRDVYTLTYYAESPVATYSVKFLAPPTIVTNLSRNELFVECTLRGTRD
jgi:hypothetical protein